MVDKFTITYVISAFQTKVEISNPAHGKGYSIQYHVIAFVSLQVRRFPPPIKMIATMKIIQLALWFVTSVHISRYMYITCLYTCTSSYLFDWCICQLQIINYLYDLFLAQGTNDKRLLSGLEISHIFSYCETVPTV